MQNETFKATNVTFGAYRLPDFLISSINGAQGSIAVTNANTFVIPVGESFQFKERAAPEVMKGYEFLNPGVTAVGGNQVELVNRDKPASAKWTKTDSETGELIGESHICFQREGVQTQPTGLCQRHLPAPNPYTYGRQL